MKKIVREVDKNQIPESFLKGRTIESEADLSAVVESYRETVGTVKSVKSDEDLNKDIQEWAAKGSDK
ncbi:hypothetical protein [Prolixibacter denitrificans]|nr:hypothetical protein [Prolixibacter denitrificans]